MLRLQPLQEAIKNTHWCDDLFFYRFYQFCVGSADPPTQKCYKNQRYFNDFENALLVSVSHFCSFRGSKDPSRTPFGEHTAPFWAPWTPPEISKRPPWSPQGAQRPPKSLALICPWLKKTLRANIEKLNFTQEKPYFWRSLVLTHSRSMCVMVCCAFFMFLFGSLTYFAQGLQIQ